MPPNSPCVRVPCVLRSSLPGTVVAPLRHLRWLSRISCHISCRQGQQPGKDTQLPPADRPLSLPASQGREADQRSLRAVDSGPAASHQIAKTPRSKRFSLPLSSKYLLYVRDSHVGCAQMIRSRQIAVNGLL